MFAGLSALPWWEIIGWTMIHFLWVGTLIGLVASVGRLLLRHATFQLRYLFLLGQDSHALRFPPIQGLVVTMALVLTLAVAIDAAREEDSSTVNRLTHPQVEPFSPLTAGQERLIDQVVKSNKANRASIRSFDCLYEEKVSRGKTSSHSSGRYAFQKDQIYWKVVDRKENRKSLVDFSVSNFWASWVKYHELPTASLDPNEAFEERGGWPCLGSRLYRLDASSKLTEDKILHRWYSLRPTISIATRYFNATGDYTDSSSNTDYIAVPVLERISKYRAMSEGLIPFSLPPHQ